MSLSRGFTLLEVMAALVILALSSILALRITVAGTDAVAIGRRWTGMAAAAEAELTRLEREYRRLRPRCALPASGSRYTEDGVGLAWRVEGDSLVASLGLEVRARAGRRPLVDSIVTTVRCR